VLELDELWSFVYRKSDKVWVWLALCRESRQIVAFVMGDRSRATCKRLWREIPEGYKGSTCYSDFWEAYREVNPEERHQATGKEQGETCHVERWINTLRQRLSRFVRKTLSFSKSRQLHHCCLKLFIMTSKCTISHGCSEPLARLVVPSHTTPLRPKNSSVASPENKPLSLPIFSTSSLEM
jgi:IS1 family transposase